MNDIEDLSKPELLALLETVEPMSTQADPQKLVETILDTACRMVRECLGNKLRAPLRAFNCEGASLNSNSIKSIVALEARVVEAPVLSNQLSTD